MGEIERIKKILEEEGAKNIEVSSGEITIDANIPVPKFNEMLEKMKNGEISYGVRGERLIIFIPNKDVITEEGIKGTEETENIGVVREIFKELNIDIIE